MPFNLKKHQNTANLDDLIVEVKDLTQPSDAEINAIKQRCQHYNMTIFATTKTAGINSNHLKQFSSHFGLRHLQHNEGADNLGVSAIQEKQHQWRKTYIPYTTKAINWHTDGYYNTLDEQIKGMLLYCDTPAPEGGENALLDHELAYLYLREQGEQYIKALMHPEAMMIPFNDVADHIQRPNRYGPVFSINKENQLHMRYTARKRNIVWRDNKETQQAVQLLADFLNSDHPWIIKATLQSGQGLICNNVLHNRSAFNNNEEQQRLLYRCRYFDRIC